MDKTLLKQVVKRMNVLTTDIKVEGYTEQEVEQVVQQLIEDGVARKSKGISFGRNAKEQEGYSVDEYKLKNLYHIDRMGNEV